jgi:hypothetical protein
MDPYICLITALDAASQMPGLFSQMREIAAPLLDFRQVDA